MMAAMMIFMVVFLVVGGHHGPGGSHERDAKHPPLESQQTQRNETPEPQARP